MKISEAFNKSPYQAKKHTSYFDAYESLFARYQGKPITFVEVGVLNGGSLFMWRSFWGPEVRIIGVDMNPNARRWEKDGFEIHIGNQASPEFWKGFFNKVGNVDVLLDDGGHTFEQQIITYESVLPCIRNGGMLVVEDTHTSYMKSFGGPSKRSFISFAKNVVDGINFRSRKLSAPRFDQEVASVTFHESIVAFLVDRRVASDKSLPIVNEGQILGEMDYRHADSHVGHSLDRLTHKYVHLRKLPVIGGVLARFWKWLYSSLLWVISRRRSLKIRKYFKY